jgi:hypothetical protein
VSARLALGAVAALAGLAALRARQGSRSQSDQHRLNDLPYDMIDIVPEGLWTLGVGTDEAQSLIEKNPILPITMQPMDLLWSKVRQSFPGADLQGAPADLWAEDHWDDRGPPHVTQLCRLLTLLLPTRADRQDPERIRDRLLSGDVKPRWERDPSARTWENANRDTQVVVGLQPRSAPTPANIGTVEGTFNLPPAIFIEGDFWDGRHRLFAARLAGLSHFPVVDLADLKGSETLQQGSSNEDQKRLYHGGAEPVNSPAPGTFFSSSSKSAADYARYGSDQVRRTPQGGFVSVFTLNPGARIERFEAFEDAYRSYRVSSTKALARTAVAKGRADLIQVYDEHIVVNPGVVTFLSSNFVERS